VISLDRLDGIAWLRLGSDQAPHVGDAEVAELGRAVEAIAADESVRAVVVGGGARHFCMGGSRATLTAPDAGARLMRLTHALPRLILAIPVPSVAAMAGHAVGGGFALGLWCDVAILADESLYGANFVSLGFTPGMGSSVVVEEALGAHLARELLFSGRLVKGRELRGAVTVCPRAEVEARARALAEEMAAAPRTALVPLKQMLAKRRLARFEAALAEEDALHAALFADPATRERVAAAYAAVPGEEA
jgi:enoyl-CoA hydratase/carnithine racemase